MVEMYVDKHMNNSKSNVREVSVAAISLGQFNSGIWKLFDRGCKYSFLSAEYSSKC